MDLTIKEAKPLIKYIIKNNGDLQKNGMDPVAVNIISQAGIGKSSLIQQIAEELDCNYVKLNLAEITETGDLVGYPICLHYCCKDDETDCQWIAPELIDSYVKAGYHITPDTKMSYALPDWYKKLDPNKKTIINLDDFTRALPNILQASYELIYKQELWSFKLPEGTTCLITSNPDDGDYNVNSIDEAGKTRMLNFHLRFDIDSWAEYAESVGLDDRVINFLLSYSDQLMDDRGTHKHIMNARSYTMFGNVIGGIQNWSDTESLAMIMQIASGSFDDEDNLVGSLFTTFIANKLDKLISPQDMLFGGWDTIEERIKNCVYDNGMYDAEHYKPAVASILQTRLLNKSIDYFSKSGAKNDVVINRILEIIDAKQMLFSEDFLFNILKTLYNKFPARLNKAMLNGRIRNIILG